MARPTIFTKQTLHKLEEAFAWGCSDQEACFYANIAASSLYKYQDDHKEFSERKEALKQNPILKARKSVISKLEKDPYLALKFLERKKREEFSLRVEQSTSVKLGGSNLSEERKAMLNKILDQ